MSESQMNFQVGDPVTHWAYGLGKIIRLDEKWVDGHIDKYYVVQIKDLTLWVKFNEADKHGLRSPTPAKDFKKIIPILSDSAEPLSDNRFTRKTQLSELMKARTLESICRLIRDLVHYKREHKINEDDNSTLRYARDFLLNEWSVSLSVPIQQAERDLKKLLTVDVV
jgi:RNA polymerase-interacting CarD/CdnL/TRCF family regulator